MLSLVKPERSYFRGNEKFVPRRHYKLTNREIDLEQGGNQDRLRIFLGGFFVFFSPLRERSKVSGALRSSCTVAQATQIFLYLD